VPVDPSNLPLNLAAAEQSQLLQTMAQLQGRAMDQAAAAQSQDQGKREASEQVQESRPVELEGVRGGEGGGGSAAAAGQGGQQERPGTGPAPPAAEEPPDPAGRGRKIDIRL